MRETLFIILYLPLSASKCMDCCLPGGDCSSAYKGGEGVCCGGVRGVGVCCPEGSFCVTCNGDVKCSYTPRSYCSPNTEGWEAVVPILAVGLLLFCSYNACKGESRKDDIIQVVSGVPATSRHPSSQVVRGEFLPPYSAAPPSSGVVPFGAGLLAGMVVSEVLEGGEECVSGGFDPDT